MIVLLSNLTINGPPESPLQELAVGVVAPHKFVAKTAPGTKYAAHCAFVMIGKLTYFKSLDVAFVRSENRPNPD